MTYRHIIRTTIALGACALPCAAMAHPGHPVGGLASGFAHPFTGLDHITAMLAVGLWAGLSGGRRRWIPILAFPGFMTLGGVLGFAGVALPGVEAGIAASLLVVGLMLMALVRSPAPATAVLVGAFAVFHGYAHGAEMPIGAGSLQYALGFVLATLSLHLAGVGLSDVAQRVRSEWVLRGSGIVAGGLGAWLLFGM